MDKENFLISEKSTRGFSKNWFWTLVTVSLLALSGCVPYQPTPPGAEPLLEPIETGLPSDPGRTGQQGASIQLTEQGRRQITSGRIDEAISTFQQAISLFPRNPYAYYYLGRAQYLRQEYQLSIVPLERAELFFLEDPIWLSRVYTLRGQTYEALSHFDEAGTQYRQALDFNRRNPDARNGLNRIKRRPEPE